MEYVINNLAQSLVILGLVLLTIEILLLALSSFVLLFVGLAAVITGMLIGLDIIQDNLTDACLGVGLFSAIVAAISWTPLKMIQDDIEPSKTTNDMIGSKFVLPEDLAPGQDIVCQYSGIEWQVSSREEIVLGLEVEIVDVSVGNLRVKQVMYQS